MLSTLVKNISFISGEKVIAPSRTFFVEMISFAKICGTDSGGAERRLTLSYELGVQQDRKEHKNRRRKLLRMD